MALTGAPAGAGPDQAPEPGPQPDRGSLYGWWVVAVLALVLVFSFLDRSILALLVEPIKADLGNAGKTDANLRVALLGSVLSFAPAAAYPVVASGTTAFLLLVATGLTGSLGAGCALAALQEMMPNRIRGRAVAFYAVIANLVGWARSRWRSSPTTSSVTSPCCATRCSWSA